MTDVELKEGNPVSYGTVESTLVHRKKGVHKSVWEDDSSDSGDDADDKEPRRLRFVFRWSDLILIVVYLILAAVALYFALSRMLPQAAKLREAFHNTTFAESPSLLLHVQPPVLITPDEPCKEIARGVLDMGGNSMDAAIAMSFCSMVVRPQSWSIGGGLLVLYYNRTTKEASVVDGLTAAPKNITKEQFTEMQRRGLQGAEVVGVPGAVRGLELASRRFGKLPWFRTVGPVSELCNAGFNVSDTLAGVLQSQSNNLWQSPRLRNLFVLNETAELLKEGDIFKRPVLAKTLDRIAQYGATEFYAGSLTKDVLRDLNAEGSSLSSDDFNVYEAALTTALEAPATKTSTLLTSHAPSGGPALGMASSLLDGMSPLISSYDMAHQHHILVEVFKQALSHRMDTSASSSYPQAQENITSTVSGSDVRPSVSYDGDIVFNDPGVLNSVGILDSSGNAVLVCSDIHGVFGSGVYSESTDIIFNGALNEYIMAPPPANENDTMTQYRPGQRVPTAAAPSMVVETAGDVNLLLSVAGPGNQTLTAAIQVLWRILHTNVTLKEAIDAPRLHHPLIPDVLYAEKAFPGVILQQLHMMGYKLSTLRTNTSVTGLQRAMESLLMNTDYRVVL